MNKNEISFHYKKSFVIPKIKEVSDSKRMAITFFTNIFQLGYVPTKNFLDTVSSFDHDTLAEFSRVVIRILVRAKGGDVNYRPMYPNFPDQVAEASVVELYLNALTHYWSMGTWLPEYEELPRAEAFETGSLIEIDLIDENEFRKIFTTLLSSND